jgi:phosphatidylserine decarboxylase
MSAMTKYLPKRRLSRLVGHLMHWRGPAWWARLSVWTFAKMYHINLNEAEKSYAEYPSIGEFFIRRLKKDLRPVAQAPALHPADSRITQCATIAEGRLIQAKGMTYGLLEFTQDQEAFHKWRDGLFITYYLCPTDYHRVHAPVSGRISDVRYIPGQLWPVNEWSTTNIPELFAINERVLVEIQTEWGPVGVVFVGATNVGHICLSFDESIQGNRKGLHAHVLQHKHYEPSLAVKAGDELGLFRMGSTVVMLYPQKFREQFESRLERGPVVKVNAALVL